MNRILLLFPLLFLVFSLQATPFSSFDPDHFFLPELADTIPPVVTCPPNITLGLGIGKCDTVFHYIVTATDDQSTPLVVRAQGIASGSLFPIGITTNLFVALDGSGNTSTCSFTVTVKNRSDILVCNDLTVVKMDADCFVSISASQVLEGDYGCINSLIAELDKTPPLGNGPWELAAVYPVDLGKTYQVRISDLSTGNKCWGSLTVKDSLAPVITCTNLTISCAAENTSPNFLRDSLELNGAVPVTMDNCNGSPIPSFVDQVQDLPCVAASNGVKRIINRVWTAKDNANNKSTCLQTITLKTSLADVHFPPDTLITVCNLKQIPQSLTDVPYLQVGARRYSVLHAFDCKLDANYYDTISNAATCDGSSRFTRTWKVYDLCSATPASNPKIGVQHVEIKDKAGPVFVNCPSDITVNVQAADCVAKIDLPDFVISDACSRVHDLQAFWTVHGLAKVGFGKLTDFPGNNLAVTDTLGVLDSIELAVGVNTIVYVASDDCGNSSECSFNLHLWDHEAPIATCDTLPIVRLITGGTTLVDASDFDHDSHDDCTNLTFKARRVGPNECQSNNLFHNKIQFCCSDVGDTIPVLLRVYDVVTPAGDVDSTFGAGQHGECLVSVIVQDTLTPGCIAPPKVVANCETLDPMLAYGQAQPVSCSIDSISTSVNYAQFDSVCQHGTITKTFKSFAAGIPKGQCTQQIQVDYLQNYFIRFPDDVIVTKCSNTGYYGKPLFTGVNCEKMQITYTDEVFQIVPDACYKIERTWKIINTCKYDAVAPLILVPNPNPNPITNNVANLVGPIVSAPGTPVPWASSNVKITFTDPNFTNFSTFWSPDPNGYSYKQIIKIIDTNDPIITNCPSSYVDISDVSDNDPLLWHDGYWYDQVLMQTDLAEGSAPELSIVATDSCSGGDLSIHYLLFLDLNADGTFETVINSDFTGTNGLGWNAVPYGNGQNPNYTGGTVRAFDERPVPVNQKFGFGLEKVKTGQAVKASVAFNTQQAPNYYVPAQLPYGTHKIKWFVDDACGNESICEHTFIIKDTKPPTVACLNGLSINIPSDQTLMLYASDFLKYTEDNVTPTAQLRIACRKSGTGTGFPVDGNGHPVTELVLTCADTGFTNIELWSIDKAGRSSFCLSPVQLKDDNNYCSAPSAPEMVVGNISTVIPDGVPNVTVQIQKVSSNGPAQTLVESKTNSFGDYVSDLNGLPLMSDLVIRPEKNTDPANGISTFDLLLMSKHILGVDTIDNPYKIIAGDVNRSNSLTTFDIIELRKLILGINTGFANNKSWRFIDKYFVFPNPANPFQTSFPEFVAANGLTGPADFIAIKVGDINLSAQTDSLLVPDDRNRPIAYFDLEDRDVNAGETVTVRLRAGEPMLGYQFTLGFDGLEMLEVLPEAGLDRDHFGFFPDALTASVETGAPAFSVQFKAKTSGRLSEFLHFSNRITRSEAYLPQGQTAEPALRFDGNQVTRVGFELLQNTPNPFDNNTQIGFNLPENCRATLRVYDQTGREVFTQTADYQRGLHYLNLEWSALNGAGLYYYELQTPNERAVRKMTVLR
ncbi:MAG: HYR domain-containing protein [Bacteroidota bacterium]